MVPGEGFVEPVWVVSGGLWVACVVGVVDAGNSGLADDWFAVDDLCWDVFVLVILDAAVVVLDIGSWDVVVVVGAVLGLVGLSWNEGVIVKVTVDSEFGVVVLEGLSFCLRVDVFVVVGLVVWSVDDWDEVLVPCWLDLSDLGVGVSVEVSVVKVNPVDVVVHVVGVVLTVGANVVLDVVVVVLVGVAFWVGLDLTEVSELWGLVCLWGDVLDFSVDDAWLGDRVGVWLWVWVVNLGDSVLELGALGLLVMVVVLLFVVIVVAVVVMGILGVAVLVCLGDFLSLVDAVVSVSGWDWEWVPVGLGGCSLSVVVEVVVEVLNGSVLQESVVVVMEGASVAVGTVVLEAAVVFVSIVEGELVVEVAEDAAEIKDLFLLGSGPLEVANLLIELLESPVGDGSCGVAEDSLACFRCFFSEVKGDG